MTTCQLCDDADATCVVLADLGDRVNDAGYAEAGAGYRAACDGCKGNSYEDPQPLTDEWRRRLGV